MAPRAHPLRVLLLAALLAGGAGRAAAWPDPAPGLEGPLPPSQTVAVGPFEVAWEGRPGRAGLVVRHQADPGRILWATRPGEGFVRALDGEPRIVGERGFFRVRDRVRDRTWRQTVDTVAALGGGVEVRGRLTGGRAPVGYRLRFEAPLPRHLRFELELDPGAPFDRVQLRAATTRDERFLGFGEQFTVLDLKGRRVPIIVQEQGIGRGKQPLTFILNLLSGAGGDWSATYAPAPHYLTSHGRSLFLEDTVYSEFDLQDPHVVEVEVFAPRTTGRILYGADPLELIEAYTEFTGRMSPLPAWTQAGAIVGVVGGEARVRQLEADLRAHGVPVTGFFIQDWVGMRSTLFGQRLWWNWEPDRASYGDWRRFVADLRQQGYRVLAYVNPFLADAEAGGKPDVRRNMFREARARGHLVERPDGTPYLIGSGGFDAGLLDLSDPAARSWMARIIRDELLGAGVSGWMGDFGEALPFDARIARGDAAAFHNAYPVAWARLQREVIEQAGRSDEVVFFSRSGFTRSPGAARLMWLGDQLTTWDRHDGMRSALTGLLSGGISGFALNHSDIGGYTTVGVGPFSFFRRTRELLWRWMELSVYSAMFRTHEGLLPGVGAQIDSDAATLDHFARCARIFRALQPYRTRLMQEAAGRGLPLVRHPWLHHPQAERLLRRSDAFLFGPDLFVAPVLHPGRRTVRPLFPPGRWVHVWTGAVYGDPQRPVEAQAPAPLGPELLRALRLEGVR